MMKQKYTFYRFREYETQAFAEYLEEMAARGWFLENIFPNFCQRFKKGEPRSLKFSVVILPTDPDADSLYREEAVRLRKLYEEAGWNLQFEGSLWHVFYSEDENPAPVDADPVLQLKMQKAVSLSLWEVIGGLFPGVLVIQQFHYLLQNPGKGLANLNRVTACMVISFLWILLVLRLVSMARWYRKAERIVSQSGSIPKVSFRTVRHRNCCYIAALFLSVFAMLFTIEGSLTTRMMGFVGAVVLAGVCLAVKLWVENRGEGNSYDRFIACFVGSLTFGFVAVMLVMAALTWAFPSMSTADGGGYARLLVFPVEFAELGYQPDYDFYCFSERTFLSAYQSEGGKRINEEGEEVTLGMEYYESPLPLVISTTKKLYPMRRGNFREIVMEENHEKEGVSIVRYHQKTDRSLLDDTVHDAFDTYVISDPNRLLVLDFSASTEPEEIIPALKEKIWNQP